MQLHEIVCNYYTRVLSILMKVIEIIEMQNV